MTEENLFRVSINGGFKDFETIAEAVNYIIRVWNMDTTIANIRKLSKSSKCPTQMRWVSKVFRH